MFFGHGLKVPWTPALYLSGLVLTLVMVRTEDVLTHGHLYSDGIADRVSRYNVIL